MLRNLLTLFLIATTPALAIAQSADASAPQPAPQPTRSSVSGWLAPNRFPECGHDLNVFTLARPGVRQRCSLHEIDEDALVCLDRNLKEIVYHRDEIATIIDPRYHGDRNATIIGFGVFAALLAGSFFVPLGWSITLRFFAGYTLFALPWLVDNGIDHPHDTLLYQSPNSTFTVHLR